MKIQRSWLKWLILMDVLAILIVSLIGFLTHYGEVRGWRWLSTFIPVAAGWLAVAPWLGVYREEHAFCARDLWRPALAAFLSAPLSAWLRGAWLNSAILPLFVLVLGLTDALGMLVWRFIWVYLGKRFFSIWTKSNG